MNKTLLKILFFLVCVLSLSCTGCSRSDNGGSGDDDDDGSGDDDFSPTSITFMPDGQGAAGDIWLEQGATDVDKKAFTLKVIGDGLTVFGVAGRLTFNESVCELTGIVAGDALEGGTAPIVAAAAGNDDGGVFGVSRSVDWRHSATIAKTKVIGTLEFSVKKAGTTTIAFNADRSRALDEGLHSVEITNWLGGELTVE